MLTPELKSEINNAIGYAEGYEMVESIPDYFADYVACVVILKRCGLVKTDDNLDPRVEVIKAYLRLTSRFDLLKKLEES